MKNYNKVVVDKGMAYFYHHDELVFTKSVFDVFKSAIDCRIYHLRGPHTNMKDFNKLTLENE